MDPEIDFRALFEQFDTFLMGRRTFEAIASGGGDAWPEDLRLLADAAAAGLPRSDDHR
jgi:hypothetical protein